MSGNQISRRRFLVTITALAERNLARIVAEDIVT